MNKIIICFDIDENISSLINNYRYQFCKSYCKKTKFIKHPPHLTLFWYKGDYPAKEDYEFIKKKLTSFNYEINQIKLFENDKNADYLTCQVLTGNKNTKIQLFQKKIYDYFIETHNPTIKYEYYYKYWIPHITIICSQIESKIKFPLNKIPNKILLNNIVIYEEIGDNLFLINKFKC